MLLHAEHGDSFGQRRQVQAWYTHMEGRASTVVPCGSPESKPKGRGQPRRSVVRTPLLLWGASLPSTPRAGSKGVDFLPPSWQRWLACACKPASLPDSRSPLGDTHKGGRNPLHLQPSGCPARTEAPEVAQDGETAEGSAARGSLKLEAAAEAAAPRQRRWRSGRWRSGRWRRSWRKS